MKQQKMSTQTITMSAILTALVIILQYVSMGIRFGTFSVTLSLIPIVIGAIVCGKWIGTWLGFVFGMIVLISGDAAPFYPFGMMETFIIVILKGMLCGLVPGVTYESVSKLMKNRKEGNVISTICASLICPIINTGIFVLGCLLFFYTDIAQVAADKGMQGNVFGFIIVFYVTFNFIFELILNIVASPTVIKILKVTKKI